MADLQDILDGTTAAARLAKADYVSAVKRCRNWRQRAAFYGVFHRNLFRHARADKTTLATECDGEAVVQSKVKRPRVPEPSAAVQNDLQIVFE